MKNSSPVESICQPAYFLGQQLRSVPQHSYQDSQSPSSSAASLLPPSLCSLLKINPQIHAAPEFGCRLGSGFPRCLLAAPAVTTWAVTTLGVVVFKDELNLAVCGVWSLGWGGNAPRTPGVQVTKEAADQAACAQADVAPRAL